MSLYTFHTAPSCITLPTPSAPFQAPLPRRWVPGASAVMSPGALPGTAPCLRAPPPPPAGGAAAGVNSLLWQFLEVMKEAPGEEGAGGRWFDEGSGIWASLVLATGIV